MTTTPRRRSTGSLSDPPERGSDRGATSSARQRALEGERDFLLGSLDDLDAEHAAGELDDDDHARLRDDYTARAAEVLRALDAGERRDRSRRRAGRPGDRRTRRWRLALMAGVAVLGVVAGVVVARSSGERLAGEFISGERLERTPTAVMAQAQEAFTRGEALEALQLVDGLLERNPTDVDARALRGWMLLNVGEPELAERGVAELDRALALDPSHPEALLYRGATHRGQGELVEALELYERLLEVDADLAMRPVVEDLVGELRAQTDPAGQVQPGG